MLTGCGSDEEKASQNAKNVAEEAATEQLILKEKAEVPLEGDYAVKIEELNLPLDEAQWELVNYREENLTAVAEFLRKNVNDGSKQEMVSVHYYDGGNRSVSMENFLAAMEDEFHQLTTGEATFRMIENSEKEGLYELQLKKDDELEDQEEIGIVFQNEGLYVVRFTVINQEMKDKDKWIEKLQEIVH